MTAVGAQRSPALVHVSTWPTRRSKTEEKPRRPDHAPPTHVSFGARGEAGGVCTLRRIGGREPPPVRVVNWPPSPRETRRTCVLPWIVSRLGRDSRIPVGFAARTDVCCWSHGCRELRTSKRSPRNARARHLDSDYSGPSRGRNPSDAVCGRGASPFSSAQKRPPQRMLVSSTRMRVSSMT